jgi:hypothetical protein
VIERIPNRFAAWAHGIGRLAADADDAPERPPMGAGAPRVVFPRAGQRFMLDPQVSPAQQEIVLRAEAAADARLTFAMDGARVCEAAVPFECVWRAERGRHELRVHSASGASAAIAFSVE